MFEVTSIHLTADLRNARPDLGACDLGRMDAAQLTAALETFRGLDPIQNHDAEPCLVIAAAGRRFNLRTFEGRLLIQAAGPANAHWAEHNTAGILDELTRVPVLTARSGRRGLSRGLAVAILAGSVLFAAHAVRSALRVETVDPPPPFKPVADARETAALNASARGRYVTGKEPGDRAIEIDGRDHVRFLRFTGSSEQVVSDDSYRLGQIGGKIALMTRSSGVVEIGDIDTISYYGDVYRRR